MRILGFNKKWPKLRQPEFTTFRFTRRDRDWWTGEMAQIVYKPRSKEREILGIAQIISKEARAMAWHGDYTGCRRVTNLEAMDDGFVGTEAKPAYFFMWEYLFNFYGGERLLKEPMNKLTLIWVGSVAQMEEQPAHNRQGASSNLAGPTKRMVRGNSNAGK